MAKKITSSSLKSTSENIKLLKERSKDFKFDFKDIKRIKENLEDERFYYELLEDIKRMQGEKRDRMRQLREEQKVYRQGETFRKAGGLLDTAGWEMQKVRREQDELNVKRFFLEIWNIPLIKILKELQKLDMKYQKKHFTEFDSLKLNEIRSIINHLTEIPISSLSIHPDELYDQLSSYLELYPEMNQRTFKPIYIPATIPDSPFKEGDLVSYYNNIYKIKEIIKEPSHPPGTSYYLENVASGSGFGFSIEAGTETHPESTLLEIKKISPEFLELRKLINEHDDIADAFDKVVQEEKEYKAPFPPISGKKLSETLKVRLNDKKGEVKEKIQVLLNQGYTEDFIQQTVQHSKWFFLGK